MHVTRHAILGVLSLLVALLVQSSPAPAAGNCQYLEAFQVAARHFKEMGEKIKEARDCASFAAEYVKSMAENNRLAALVVRHCPSFHTDRKPPGPGEMKMMEKRMRAVCELNRSSLDEMEESK